jgi:hypothetical protein
LMNSRNVNLLRFARPGAFFYSNIFKILKEKLDRRNIVAHSSNALVVQSRADDVVTDLINNVVLALV